MNNRNLNWFRNLVFTLGFIATCFLTSSETGFFNSKTDISKIDYEDKKQEVVTTSPKSLLFFNSYSLRWPDTVRQLKGLKDSLYSYVSITEEYMDTKNISYTETRKTEIYNNVKEKYKDTTFDYIVVGDDDALDFMMDYHDELFNSVPVIFEGINSEALGDLASLNPYFTGIIERVSYGKNIEFASALMPDAKVINVISDSSATSVGDLDQFITEVTPYPELTYNFIKTTNLTSAQFKDTLKSLTGETINFFLGFSETSDKHYDQDERMAFIKANLNAPMFTASSMGIGTCFVGGYVYSHFYAGKMTGGIVDSIIQGTQISDIKVNLASFSNYILDYKLFTKYKLSEDNIPSDEVVTWMNKTTSVFEEYKIPFIIWISVSVSIVLFMAFAVIVAIKQKSKNKELTEVVKQLEASRHKIDEMNKTDYLTGLNNPREFHLDISHEIENKKNFYLMIVDIDNFKSINDLFGHETGDKVIIAVSALFKAFKDDKCRVYRFGGDEFSFILSDYSYDEVESLAYKINAISKRKITIDSNAMAVNFSVGISHAEPTDVSEANIIARADSAMYYVKQTKKNGHAFYNPLTMKSVNESAMIADELEKAIEGNRVYMVFQPLYFLSEKKFMTVEALMRISDFNYGPSAFIPVAEHSNLIIKLGRIAVKQSLKFKGQLNKAGLKDIKVEINFSAAQVSDEGFFQFFDRECEENGVKPDEVIFELTETVYFKENAYTDEILKACQKRKIDLALDDFGSGYSSINSLSKIKYRYVKFDKTIIDSMFDDLSIGNLISFCHGYGCLVVAEGVESKEQSDYLKKEKCDIIQGFYYSTPLDKKEAYKLLTNKDYPVKEK